MKSLLLLTLTTIFLSSCSTNKYRNEEFEESQKITIEFSNASIAQRHIDEFAQFVFEKSEVLEAVDYVRDYSKKSGQYKVWESSLEKLAAWLDEVNEPGNYKYDEGFQPRTSLIAWLLEKKKGKVCCRADKTYYPSSELLLAQPSKEHIKTYNQWATEPIKFKEYFMTKKKERVWPNLTLKMNAFGE